MRRKFPLTASFAAVLATLSFSPGALAQPTSSVSLEPVVITASRSDQALPDALLSTKVISRTQIEQSQAVDLPALIRNFTAIDVAQSGPHGSQTSIFLRGADSRQVLLVVDGVPMNRADFGSGSWEHLSLDQIERVEIVRGNASALWGAQAIGGVVQIITRRATEPEFTVGLGTQKSAHASIAAGKKLGEGDRETRLSMALSERVSGGFNATDPSTGKNPDRDANRQTAGSVHVEHGWAAGHSTALNLSSTHTHSALDTGNTRLDDQLTTKVEAIGLNSRHSLAPSLRLDLDAGQTREGYTDPTGFTTAGANRTQQGQAQLQWQLSAGHSLVGALEGKQERTESRGSPSTSRITRSTRLGWLGQYANAGQPIEVQTSLRHDDSSTYAGASTGLVALAWSPLQAWKLSSQWSTAFSAPSFIDQQFAAPGVTLRPERSRNVEVAAQYWQGEHSARLAWFRQRQHDRIGFDVDGNGINIDNSVNRGIELMAQTRLGSLALGGEAIWQNPRNLDSGRELARRARQTQVVNLRQTVGQAELGASLRHTGERRDSDFNNAYAPSRTTLGLTAGWRISSKWRVAAKLDNATDSQRPEVVGYTPAPRSLGVSLSGKL
jgi:vitamin B12 transporter